MSLFKKYKWLPWVLGGLYLLFVAFTPYLFSQKYTGIKFDQSSGVIGDTIGGITAPFINLLAAFLVFISFRAQIKANEQLNKENKLNYLSNFFKIVESEIKENLKKGDQITSADLLVRRIKGHLNDLKTYPDGRLTNIQGKVRVMSHKEMAEDENEKIKDDLFKLNGQTSSLLSLTEELVKGSIEPGISKFYLHRIQSLINEMEVEKLYQLFRDVNVEQDKLFDKSNKKYFAGIISNLTILEFRGLLVTKTNP